MKKKLNTEGTDKFFYYISKGVILTPIIIVVVALIFRSATPSAKINKGNVNLTPAAFQSNTPNLKGPYICGYQDSHLEVKAHLKDGKALVNIKTSKDTDVYLFDGDCLYADGKKQKCGLKPYVPLAENVFKGGLLST